MSGPPSLGSHLREKRRGLGRREIKEERNKRVFTLYYTKLRDIRVVDRVGTGSRGEKYIGAHTHPHNKRDMAGNYQTSHAEIYVIRP